MFVTDFLNVDSAKALRSADKEDDTLWLIYWTVYGVFAVFDFFAEFIFQSFPIYWYFCFLFTYSGICFSFILELLRLGTPMNV